ncbi:MAG: host-nuclease inhibitor Gam family protein [Pseudomonadota bacterium]
MSRRKQEAIAVPANKAEAELMIAEYTELERTRLLEELAADEAIARVKEQLALRRREIDAEAKPIFDGLKAWWEAGGKDEVARGKRSGALGASTVGIRLGMPALKFKRGMNRTKFLDWLLGLRLAGKAKFLRVPKTQLDANAVIKTLREGGSTAASFERKGAFVEQKDEFFIDTGLDADELKKEVVGP